MKNNYFGLVVIPNSKKVIESINTDEKLPFYSAFKAKDKLFESVGNSWKTIDKDMKDVSLRFPNVVFRLDVRECKNEVRYYYKNGKKQIAKLCKLFEKFDEGKLTEI